MTLYFNTYKKDNTLTRVFVGAVGVLNVFKSIMCGATLWTRSVDKFGDWNGITHGYWEQRTQVLMSEIIAFAVHGYFILRVFRLTKKNYYLLVWLTICAFMGLGGGIAFTFMIYAPTDGTHIIRFGAAMTTMLVGMLSCDTSITIAMFFALANSKTGFNGSDSLVNRLIRLTWMCAVPPTICAVLNLAFYQAVTSNDTFVAFNIVLSYLASISMMYTVNSRKATMSGIINSSGQELSDTRARAWSLGPNKKDGTHIELGNRTQTNNVRVQVNTATHTFTDPSDVPGDVIKVHDEQDSTMNSWDKGKGEF
ncbi:hypothetical protein B0H19DRAFT_1260485 [Mycena capillaripes]|nr:hypothetical protein B0H19DRAFT_1260485 [Mycena capillaripes]